MKHGFSDISKDWNLQCLKHASELTFTSNVLVCPFGCIFQIINDIPRFTSEEYSSSFAFQWKRFPITQFDSVSKLPVTLNRLKEACGENLWPHLSKWKVLEAGCGAGRFTEVLLKEGADVLSSDLSQAIDVNIGNFPITSKHLGIQADLQNLPIQPNSYDLVCCLGVLQHTPNPEKSIESLIRHVKPGGWLVIDHYARSRTAYFRTAYLVRIMLKRLPPEVSMRLVSGIYSFSSPFFGFSRNRFYRKILLVLFPIVYFDEEIPNLSKEAKREWGILDTFDALTDWYKHKRDGAEIRATLLGAGLINVTTFEGGNGIVARGQKSLTTL